MKANIRGIDMSKAQGTIPVLRFIRPNGQRKQETIAVSGMVVLKWQNLQGAANGVLRLTVEDLGNGNTSLCIEHPDKGDVDMRLMPTNLAESGGLATNFAEMIAKAYEEDSMVRRAVAPKAAPAGPIHTPENDVQCKDCKYAPQHMGTDGDGWCYMFKERPVGYCAKETAP